VIATKRGGNEEKAPASWLGIYVNNRGKCDEAFDNWIKQPAMKIEQNLSINTVKNDWNAMLRNFSVPAAASGWLVAYQISLPLGVDIINNEIAYAALAEPISSLYCPI